MYNLRRTRKKSMRKKKGRIEGFIWTIEVISKERCKRSIEWNDWRIDNEKINITYKKSQLWCKNVLIMKH